MSPLESRAMPCGAKNLPASSPGPFSPPSRAMRFPFRVDDGQARTQIRHLAIDRHARTEFANDKIRLLAAAAIQRAGPVQIIPLRLVFAVAVEHLDAVVLAVGDIDEAVGIGCDVVDDVELAGIGAR